MTFWLTTELELQRDAVMAWSEREIDNSEEQVAIAVQFDPSRPLLWFAMLNELELPEANRAFQVSGVDVFDLVGYIKATFGESARLDTLWHSHVHSPTPSELDVETFPADMFRVGKVYHAPSGRTTSYDLSGIVA